MQTSLLLLIWLAYQSLHSWLKYTARLISLLNGPTSVTTRLREWHERAERGNQLSATVHCLVEFHKAQCFFIITLHIAMLLVLNSDADTLGWNTLNQATDNISFINDISLGGTLPTVFALFLQHCMGKRSWYVFTLTIFAGTISTHVWFQLAFVELETLLTFVVSTTELYSCGNANPVKFCGGEDWLYQLDKIPTCNQSLRTSRARELGSMVVVLVVFLGLLIDLLWVSRHQFARVLSRPPVARVYYPLAQQNYTCYSEMDFSLCGAKHRKPWHPSLQMPLKDRRMFKESGG